MNTRESALAKAFLQVALDAPERGYEVYRTSYRDRLLMRSNGFLWYFGKPKTYRGLEWP